MNRFNLSGKKELLFAIVFLYAAANYASAPQSDIAAKSINKNRVEMKKISADLESKFEKLRPQSIRPAEGFIKYDYLIPAGFYKQMWDWDGFFIGYHLCSIGRPEYLKYWVLNFVAAIDSEGYVPGCITNKGPRPIFGKFAMKPFLAQGAFLSSVYLKDFSWIENAYDGIKKVCQYREKTQYDEKYGLFFWDNAMQSGADNNPALTNDDREASAILGVDINVFQYREYLAMEKIAASLGKSSDAEYFKSKAEKLKAAILKYHWDKENHSFWNVRRRDGRYVKRISYSNFIPLIQKDILPYSEGREMIKKYLWNKKYMLSEFGLRSLAKNDPDYNNENIIVPYSNWQGPIWPIANYLYFVGLWNYGFDAECSQLAKNLGLMIIKDINTCGSMHENYHAESGEPLAPTAAQSKDGIFTGFVGWNLLIQNMFMGIIDNKWMLLEVK